MLLGVNIDHVATVRQARGECYPDPVKAAQVAMTAGADLITLHVREDRRHVQEDDLARLTALATIPINLEMALTDEMCAMAAHYRPAHVCVVPEKRAELTTEGGLAVTECLSRLQDFSGHCRAQGVKLSLFVDPDPAQIEAARAVGADAVELHTGAYAQAAAGSESQAEALASLHRAALLAHELGLEVHAGHGLDYDNVAAIARLPHVTTLNIGYSLIAESIFLGLAAAVREMRLAIVAV